jgi:hypothetical protein
MRSIPDLQRALKSASEKSRRLCLARAELPPGSSRARVTTANARWKSAAEERERLEAELLAAVIKDGGLR